MNIKKQGLVSIIIPIYNSEKYLAVALDSVQKQSYSHIEVLMINDGSTDASENICAAYVANDSRFRLINQKNQGPSAARNHGIREAKGDYITFLDSDDMIHENFVEILYQLVVQYECDIALTKSFPFLEESVIPWGKTEEKLLFMDHKELSMHLVDTDWTGLAVVMAKIYRKSLFDHILFDESLMRCEDDTILYQLYWNAEKSVLYEAPLYFYRSQREGSLTHSKFEMSWLTAVDVFKKRMDFYNEKGEKILYAHAMRAYCRRVAENYFKVKKHFPQEKDTLKELKRNMRRQTWTMLLLPGNSVRQKVSALLFAWIPDVWGKVYVRL